MIKLITHSRIVIFFIVICLTNLVVTPTFAGEPSLKTNNKNQSGISEELQTDIKGEVCQNEVSVLGDEQFKRKDSLSKSEAAKNGDSKIKGTLTTFVGVMALSVGVFYKFGGGTRTGYTESNSNYNVYNFSLIMIGSSLTIYGIQELINPKNSTSKSSGLNMYWKHEGNNIGLCYTYQF